ncbi:hypothetical protein SSIG_07952 [Streptomyces filamentosus NRRL 11379]|nr:hypothetical protein SSIG_07952 [Streptomyces filamentosus NRRL 11379]
MITVPPGTSSGNREPDESGGEDIDDCRCDGHCPQPEEHRPHPRGHRLTTSLLIRAERACRGHPVKGFPCLSRFLPSLLPLSLPRTR